MRCTRPRHLEPVDDGGDRGTAHRQALGQGRGHRGAFGQHPQDPVLGERQLDVAQGQLDLLGEPGGGTAEGPRLVPVDAATAALGSPGVRSACR